MKSLRGQLVVGTVLGAALVWLASGALIHGLVGRTLRAGFDEALLAKARSLATLAEEDEDGLEFELAEFPTPEFKDAERPEYFQLRRADGTVFARSPSLQGTDLPRPTASAEGVEFQTVTLPDGRAGRIVAWTFAPRQERSGASTDVPTMLTLVIGRETAGLHAALTQVRRILIGVCLPAVVLSAVVLGWIVRRSLRPVGQLSAQISRVGENDLGTRIDPSGVPQELVPVVDRINDLLVRLDAAFRRERRFTGDVAHELRTPLAGLRAKLELALSRDRDAGAYRKTIDDCLPINLHLQRMVENLLHLARADAGQQDFRNEPVDVEALLRDCWRPLEDKARDRGLRVEWDLTGRHSIETDGDKLRLVINNALDNAVAHADDQGRVTISTHADNGCIGLTVSNTASTMPAEAAERVFDRFWRGDPSFRQSGDTHCGLGLALCKALVEQLGGTVQASTGGGVFTLAVRLPGSRS